VISGGLILTNWHVVGDFKQVGVIFKPADALANVTGSDVVRADVIKTDKVRDLALLRPVKVPPTAKPIEIAGQQDVIEKGADVHAIGHPTGEAWTYTKGIVSQIRRDFDWESESVKAPSYGHSNANSNKSGDFWPPSCG
jgi:S1-C subfamily serine protease